MCEFFSCVSDGKGRVYYFDAKMRQKIIAGETEYQDTDSHTSVAHWYGFRGSEEDTLNKYEYNPLTGRFIIDQQNTTYDAIEVEEFCYALDFSTVVPELVIKPIVNPLRYVEKISIEETDIELLKVWASVGDSVRASVGDSVWASVGDSVGASVWASVGDSVWASVRASVGDSVRASVGDSVRASVWASVRASVGAWVWDSFWDSFWDSVYGYISGFFVLDKWEYIDHKPGTNPFQPCIDLWERGFVPSFDGTTWRLHTGATAEIVYEWTP